MKNVWKVTLVTLWSGLIWGIYWLLQILPQWVSAALDKVASLESGELASTTATFWPEGGLPIPTQWVSWAMEIYPMLLPFASALLWVVWGIGVLCLWGVLPRLVSWRKGP